MAAPIVDPDDALLDKLAGVASAPGAAPRRALSDDELLNQLSGTTAPAAVSYTHLTLPTILRV